VIDTTISYNSTQQKEILKVLNYYHVFKHPLRADEIHKFINIKLNLESLKEILNNLITNKEVYLVKGYYCLYNDPILVENRIKGEIKAGKLLVKAKRIGRLISFFPFVRFVGISGSLSKGFADEKTDFDYFIITKTGRLWICRTILHLFKKFSFLFNLQKCFCMNYFIDESSMELEDENIYVMYEMATMIPVYNQVCYDKFINSNKWVTQKLPQFDYNLTGIYNHKSIFKSLLENCFRIFPLNALNSLLMKITNYKWKRKWKKANYPNEDYELAFRTRINISKNHPKNYQKLLLTKLADFL